jgi:hypothetical protein
MTPTELIAAAVHAERIAVSAVATVGERVFALQPSAYEPGLRWQSVGDVDEWMHLVLS